MDEYGITITDPNYRDVAAREERWLNEPFFYEKLIAHAKQIHKRLFSKQKIH
jgi:hypothetical protein